MIAEDMTMQALRKEVSELTLRLNELGEENRDLRELCNERGIPYAERLAARRHKRYFADLLEKHPIGRTATASDVLGAAPAVRGIAGCAGDILRTGLIARCFFAAFTHLTAQLPWRFGGRLSATFEGHEEVVWSLAVLAAGCQLPYPDRIIIRSARQPTALQHCQAIHPACMRLERRT